MPLRGCKRHHTQHGSIWWAHRPGLLDHMGTMGHSMWDGRVSQCCYLEIIVTPFKLFVVFLHSKYSMDSRLFPTHRLIPIWFEIAPPGLSQPQQLRILSKALLYEVNNMTSRCIVFDFERDSFCILQLHQDPLTSFTKEVKSLSIFFFKSVKKNSIL